MLHRRSTATVLVAVLLPVAAALTSCSEDPRTNQINTIGAGTNNQEASVDVLGARVVAYSDGVGRLIGTLVYNDDTAEEPAVLEEVAGEGVQVGGGEPLAVEVAGNRYVNLAAEDAEPIPVEGEFAAGDVLELSYSFSTDEVVTFEVPVVKPCGQYADIAAPGADTGTAAEEAGEEGEEIDEEADATYLCEHPTESAEGEEEGGH